jgi:hypothetical protein
MTTTIKLPKYHDFRQSEHRISNRRIRETIGKWVITVITYKKLSVALLWLNLCTVQYSYHFNRVSVPGLQN